MSLPPVPPAVPTPPPTAPTPVARRPLGADRVVALVVALASLLTMGWLVATDGAPASGPLADANGDVGVASASPASGGTARMPGHDGAQHATMHDDPAHQPMHPAMHAAEDGVAATVDDPDDADATGTVEAGTTTLVRMHDFSFDLPAVYAAGVHTFEVVNEGQAPHEFALGAVGDHHTHVGQTEWLDAGGTQTLTVELEPGTYEVGCHVPGHYEAGMAATITVVG